MNVAVVGTGAWGKVLHAVANEMGHAATWINPRLIDVGEVRPPKADAILFAVPPHIQAQLAPAYIEAGIPCFLEKPVCLPLRHDSTSKEGTAWAMLTQYWSKTPPKAVVACDHLRTMAPSWQAFKAQHRKPFTLISVVMGGPGPVRNWPVAHPFLWDYGPHALAYVLDLLGQYAYEVKVDSAHGGAMAAGVGTIGVRMHSGLVKIDLAISNGVPEKRALVQVDNTTYLYNAEEEKPLRDTLQAFFDAVAGKAPLPPQLSLARGVEIVKLLEEIEAKLSRGVASSDTAG